MVKELACRLALEWHWSAIYIEGNPAEMIHRPALVEQAEAPR
jgi:hypothetical protein